MKKKFNEQLSSEVSQLIPEDMFERIRQNAIPAPERTEIMSNTSTPTPRNRGFTPRRFAAALAACLLLVLGAAGMLYYSRNIAADSVVNIDVNPSIELITNKKDRVVSANAINDDGAELLSEMDLKNVDLNVAVNALIGAMVNRGYIMDGENGILVTVLNDDSHRATHVRNIILADINDSLKNNNVTASVLNQIQTEDVTAREFSDAHGISFGKAVFLLNLADIADIDAASLSSASISEIASVITSQKVNLGSIINYDSDDSLWENLSDVIEDINDQYGSHPDLLITGALAKEIALAHAGISGSVAFIKAEPDTDDSIPVYEVEFLYEGVEYDYEINALTGEIIKSETERDERKGKTEPPANDTSDNTPVTLAALTLEDAKAAALVHAGLTADAVSFIKAKLDYEDGVRCYEIEFTSGGYEYDYEINAATGAVISYEREYDDDRTTDVTEKPYTPPAEPSLITLDEAKATALTHAGLTADAVIFTQAKQDTDDGIAVYDIEFTSGGYEYDYEINAATGAVISSDREYDDDRTPDTVTEKPSTPPAEPSIITLDEAKATALTHAGLTADAVIFTQAKQDTDDGIAVYDIEFTSGGYEYDYDINAATGAVISSDREYDDDRTPDTATEKPAAPAVTDAHVIGVALTADEARSVACIHAGLDLSAISLVSTELDRDDGIAVYEIEFISGGYEYEYEINAATGAVISYERELCD